MAGNTHIIHKLVLDIEVPHRSSARKVQDDAVQYFEQVLLEKLEQLLDSMDVPDHVLIDKIDLDLGKGKLEDVFEQLQEKLSKVLEPVVNSYMLPNVDEPDHISHSLLSDEQQAFNVFVYFLNNGRLPWYVVSSAEWLQQEAIWLDKLSRLLVNNGPYKLKLADLFKGSQVVLNRLFSQFTLVFIKKLVAAIIGLEVIELQANLDSITAEIRSLLNDRLIKGNQDTFLNELNSAGNVIGKLLLMIYLRRGSPELSRGTALKDISVLFAQEINATILISAGGLIQIADKAIRLAYSTPAPDKDKPIATPDHAYEIAKAEEIAGTYINQAGLVILHPFLEYFFKDFGLLQDNGFVDLSARQLAVHLLHYLGTGNLNAFEYDMHFEKFLCQWPAGEPLEREIEIPQRMLEEGENMLRTVVKYWKALKNTSPGGLRQGFLMRNGKLTEAERPVRLIVEHKDLDILLSSLPWGIGVIKLPWMDEPFYVDWQ